MYVIEGPQNCWILWQKGKILKGIVWSDPLCLMVTKQIVVKDVMQTLENQR